MEDDVRPSWEVEVELRVVARDSTTNRDETTLLHQTKHVVEDLSADIVKVHIGPVALWQQLVELLLVVGVLVVDRVGGT